MDHTRRNFWMAIAFFALAAFELITDLVWSATGFGVVPTWHSIMLAAVFFVVGVVMMVRRKRF